jgi:phospholipid/cholesterol/gamma-HCH transport system permease protein
MSASVFSNGPGEGGTGEWGVPLSPRRLRDAIANWVSTIILGSFAGVGARVYYLRDIIRGLAEPGTYLPETLKQMRAIGVDSLPLASLVAAFIGSVIALQSRYQLFPGVQLSIVGLISRQMIILELGPLLTGLVLAGRVGAQMTAEIGTMRVTEQIDALETLAYDPLAYLVVPRMIAGLIMLPVLTVYADAIGIVAAFLTSTVATDIHYFDFRDGLRLGFSQFQLFYSLLKAVMFGGAISFLCTYEGYVASAGAEGVGKATAKAVVIASVWILVLDALTAGLLAKYLQT